MSGGSYNYLCHQDADDLARHETDLQDMAERLAGVGYAEDAARETEETLLILRQLRGRLQTRIDRLAPIWRAVEWWDSGDGGEEGLQRALTKYRGTDE